MVYMHRLSLAFIRQRAFNPIYGYYLDANLDGDPTSLYTNTIWKSVQNESMLAYMRILFDSLNRERLSPYANYL